VRLGQAHGFTAKPGSATRDHGHELEHQQVGVGADHHRHAVGEVRNAGAGGQFDQRQRAFAAEAQDLRQFAPRAGVHHGPHRARVRAVTPWLGVGRQAREQFARQLAGAGDQERRGVHARSRVSISAPL